MSIPRIALLVGLFVLLAAVFPVFSTIRVIITIPLWLSFGLVLAITSLTWSIARSPPRVSPSHTRRYGLHTLSFTTPSAWSAVLTRTEWEERPSPSFFPPIHPSSTEAVNTRLEAIFKHIRESFIDPWYSRLSPSAAFPNAVEVFIRKALADIVKRSDNVDWPAILVSRIVPLVRDHIHHYRAVEHLSSTSPSAKSALPLPLPAHGHRALSHAAHVPTITPTAQIEAYFRDLMDKMVHEIVPESDRSPVVLTMAREILLGSVLMPVFEMLCDSDFWNRQIDERGGRYLHEQKQVNKFLSALANLPDPGLGGIDSQQNSPLRSTADMQTTSISAASSTRQFEAFLRSIPKVKTLGEARRLRSDVDREQRLARSALEFELRNGHHGNKNTEHSLKRAKKYLKRLERARIEVDAKIRSLSHTPLKSDTPLPSVPTLDTSPTHLHPSHIDLHMVLGDPSSLAYWLEYMERRNRSRLVQFWLTIESFKDPLEGLGQNASMEGTLLATDRGSGHGGQTVHEDLKFLFETYISSPDPLFAVPTRHQNLIAELASAETLAPTEIKRAKQAMFASQQAVFEQMQEEDWSGFTKSELFVKASGDLSRGPAFHSRSPISSPHLVSSPRLASPPMPPVPVRHQTAPLMSPKPEKGGKSPLVPSSRPLPVLLGHVTPTALPPAASVSMAPPDFSRRATSPDTNATTLVNKEDLVATNEASTGNATPLLTNVRRSSNLDFLISGEPQASADDRSKLFGDDDDVEDLVEDDDEGFVQIQRMEAIQAALSEIIAGDDLAVSRTLTKSEETPEPEPEPHYSPSSSMVLPNKSESIEPLARLSSKSVDDLRAIQPKRPSLSTPQSRKLSSNSTDVPVTSSPSLDKRQKLLFEDEILDQEAPGSEYDKEPEGPVFTLLADVDFAEEVRRLQEKIEELVKQEHLLETLIRQAELTGNAAELRILQRSQNSIRREQRTAIFQKAQYEQQEEENRLTAGTTVVTIPTAVISNETGDTGKQYVLYNIRVERGSEEGARSWMVPRRYNEFWELDKALREWASTNGQSKLFRNVQELPPKRLVPNLSAAFVESRRQGLERHLKSLVASQVLCDTPLLRAFLSRSALTADQSSLGGGSGGLASLAPHNIVKSIYKTMATSLDDKILGPNMLDMMYSTLSRQLTDFGGLVGISSEEIAGMGSSLLPQALKGGWSKDAEEISTAKAPSSPIAPIGGETGSGSFTAPICDLFVEMFDLKENNWLRRQAIVVILQQFLGSTIERKVRDSIRSALTPNSIERVLTVFQETLWPEGVRRPPSEPRTEEEMAETRYRASKKLGLLIPDLAANMIGRGNARRAARRTFGALQDKRLNQHLMLCILDEIFGALFPSKPLNQGL